MQIHPSITVERVLEAVRRQRRTLDNPGFCVDCGMEVEGVEPDAREYQCDGCGTYAVYGAEEILIDMV